MHDYQRGQTLDITHQHHARDAADASDDADRDVASSPRELDVLRLIAAGLSNAEIAEHQDVTITTAKALVRTVYQRIGAERRSQAIVWCFDNDIEVHPEALL